MFRITNFAFNALVSYNQNIRKLNASLEELSTGLRINKAVESKIRDLDFAKELAEFNKTQLLVQSGSFALSQTIKTMEIIMKLLKRFVKIFDCLLMNREKG